MTRKKVKIEYISNDSARKATFKKRKKGLMKKVSELSTLCGISACAMVFSPYDSQPEVWPDPIEAWQVITRFRNLPAMDQTKNLNQESFLEQRITKADEQLKKQHEENHKKEITLTLFECIKGKKLDTMTMEDLKDIKQLVDTNLKDFDNKMVALPRSNSI